MLKENLVPTPLVVRKGDTRAPLEPIQTNRSLFIGKLLMRVLWHSWMTRFKPPHGPSGEYTTERLAKMVRGEMERLGGLWVKAAQIMAMRRDIFSKEFCDELGSLHDRARGFSGDIAVKIIEEDLKRPIDEVFSEFDKVPIAAASIGQVHRARLRDGGKWVAVKVQRPAVAEAFRKDLDIIRGYVSVISGSPAISWMRMGEMVKKLERTLAEELDYRIEAGALRRMRLTLKRDKVYAPRIYRKYCTRRVLTMEFISGVLMSDYIQVLVDDPKKAKAWRKENQINPKKFGKRLYLNYLRQLLSDNLSHGDLHPGNIMMLRKNRFALIDFGSISVLDEGFLLKYKMSLRVLSARNFSKYVDIYLNMVSGVPDVDIEALRKEIVAQLDQWQAISTIKGIPYEQRSLLGGVSRLSDIFAKYKLPPIWSSLRAMRSGAALDASLRFLVPNMNWFKLAGEFFQREQAFDIKAAQSKPNRLAVLETVNDLLPLPKAVGENMVFQADLIRKRAMNFQADISKAARIGKAFVEMLMNVGLVVTGVVIIRYLAKQHNIASSTVTQSSFRDVLGSIPHLTPGMWIALIVLFVYLLRSLRNLARDLGVVRAGTNPYF